MNKDEIVVCKYCGYRTEKKYLFYCPTHGEFHNGYDDLCGKFKKRCDGIWNHICCPVCGFMPCERCHGKGKNPECPDEICYRCKGTGKEPFRLRSIPRKEPNNFKERMLLQAKEFAIRSGIRYMYVYIEKGDYISLKNVSSPRYSISFPLDKAQRKNFYGWLNRFAKGKNRRFKYRWKRLLD